MNQWVIEPFKLRAVATAMMLYYKQHVKAEAAAPFYKGMCRAQAYIERLQDEGATFKATDLEAWLPSQRDMQCHVTTKDGCTCEGNRLNHIYCVHMAAFDLIQMVMAGKDVRRV